MFFALGLFFLIVGLIGIGRLFLRSGCQCRWENRGNDIIVTEVFPGGVAEKNGLAKGDVLLKIDQLPVKRGSELEFLLDGRRPGQKVSFTVQRGSEQFTISFNLVTRYGRRFADINLLLGLLFWTIGIFVYLKKPDERAARVFFWGCMTCAVSGMMVWPGHSSEGEVFGYFLSGLYFLLYSLAPAFILYFVTLYPSVVLHQK